MRELIDICVACSPSQSSDWWAPLISNLMREEQRGLHFGQVIATASALPDSNKNEALQQRLPEFDKELFEQKKRADLTDVNRNVNVWGFMQGDAQGNKAPWVMWLDDDTVMPDGTISRLLDTGKNFIAGMYHLARAPFNPIAYVRHPEDKWGYRALYGYSPGSLFQIDSVGMGCTLIHRSVYEKIMAEHTVFTRPNGTLCPVHYSKIHDSDLVFDFEDEERVVNGRLVQKLDQVVPDDNRAWPFYQMEYVRTEDHYFCELAAAVGIKPWIDTSIHCEHIKSHHVTYEDYRSSVNDKEGLSIRTD